jgi:predicted transcriptional regulator
VSTVQEVISAITSDGSMTEPEARAFLSERYGRPINDEDLELDILDLSPPTAVAAAPAPTPAAPPTPAPQPSGPPAPEEEEGVAGLFAKEAAGFGYGLVGAAHGAAEGVGDVMAYPGQVAAFAKDVNESARQLSPLDEQFERIRDSRDLTDEEKNRLLTPIFEKQKKIGKRLETARQKIKTNSVAQAQDDQAELIRTRLRIGRGAFDNLVKDVNDIARAFPGLFKEMIFTTVPPNQRKELQDWDKYLDVAYDQRRKLARNLVGGTIGGTSGILMGLIKAPQETVEATPGMAVMTLVGLIPALQGAGAVKALSSVPGYSKLTAAMQKAGAWEVPGTIKRKQLVKGADEAAPGIQKFKEGEGRVTAGDIASTAGKGFGYGMLVGAPVESAVLAPLVRGLYGVGMNSPKFAEAAAKVRRLVAHTSAQRGMAMERAVRDLMDDAARDASKVKAIAEGLAREQAETGRLMTVSPRELAPFDSPILFRDSKVQFRTDRAKELGDRLNTVFDDLRFGRQSRENFRANLADITEGGSAVLASPTVRAMVAKKILEGSGKNKAKFEPQIMAALERAAGNVDFNVMDLSRLLNKRGSTINLKLLVDDALKELGETGSRKVQADLIMNEFAQLENRVAVRSRQLAMDREAMKFLTDEQKKAARAGTLSPDDYAIAMAVGRMVNGDSINQALLRGMKPNELIDALHRAMGDGKLKDTLVNRLGRELTDAEKKMMPDLIREMSEDLRKYGEEILNNEGLSVGEMRSLLAEGGDWNLAPGTLTRRGVKEMVDAIESSSAKGGSDRYLSAGLRATEGWRNSWNLNLNNLWGRMNSYMKMNLTVMNPAVHLNNFMSNVSLQAIRRGIDPVTLLGGAAKETKQYRAWRKGRSGRRKKDLSDVGENIDQRIYEAIDEMKLIDTDLIGIEIDSVAGYGLLDVVAPGAKFPGRKIGDRIREAAAKGYRWGDQIFKIDEAAKSMRELYRGLDELRPKEFMDIQTSAITKTRIRKDAKGDIFIGKDRLSKDGKFVGKGRERLDRAFTATARKRAVDLFVDYAQVPGALKVLRQAGPLAIASPFLTWNWKAMGIGGRSLLSRAIAPTPLIKSNNPRVMIKQARKLAAETINRNLILHGIKANMMEDRGMIEQVLAYDPSMPRVKLFTALGDPSLIGVDDVNSMNFAGPAMGVLRAGATAVSWMPGFKGATERDKLLAMKSRGELLSGRQAFRLLGAEGGLVTGLWDAAINDWRTLGGKPNIRGQKATNPEILRRQILPLITPMGQAGTAAAGKAMDVAIGAYLDDDHYASNLRNTHSHPRAPEDMAQFTTRHLFGVAWKPVALSGSDNMFDRYLKTIEKSIKESSKAIKKKLDRQKKDGTLSAEGYRESMDRYRRIDRAATEEYRDIRKSIQNLRRMILKKSRKRAAK